MHNRIVGYISVFWKNEYYHRMCVCVCVCEVGFVCIYATVCAHMVLAHDDSVVICYFIMV